MRIYLACTVRGDRSGVEVARLVAARLEALGHEVLTGHLLQDNVDDAEASVGNVEVFERDLRWLDACDVLVAEASGSTYGVGFEVGYITGRAPRTGQRAIVLFDARREATVSRMLSGNVGVAAGLSACAQGASARPRRSLGEGGRVGGCLTLAYRTAEEAVALVERAFEPAADTKVCRSTRNPADAKVGR